MCLGQIFAKSFARPEVLTGFVTLFLAVRDGRHQVLRYVNAGHPPALVVTLTSGQPALQLLRNSGPALGVIDSPDLREEAMPWSAGATLLIYTDGIIEARRGNEPQFSLDGLTQTVLEHFRSQPNSPPNNLLEVICTALPSPSANHHSVDFHRDDQTLLALRVQ